MAEFVETKRNTDYDFPLPFSVGENKRGITYQEDCRLHPNEPQKVNIHKAIKNHRLFSILQSIPTHPATKVLKVNFLDNFRLAEIEGFSYEFESFSHRIFTNLPEK